MVSQHFLRLELGLGVEIAALDCAFELEATLLPVLSSLTVLELLGAVFTLELDIVEGLLDKPVQFGIQIDSLTAVWACLILLFPLADALSTDELVAVETFLRLFDNHQANRA